MRNSIRGIYCSPEKRGLVPPEKRTRRVNGVQLPLHPLQIFARIVLSGIAAGTFSVLIPRSNEILFVVTLASFSLHLASHLAALLIDPAENELRKRRPEKPEFDGSLHHHYIENGRCHICNIDASGTRTKHCWECNKCVWIFDHHCVWLNNCIGKRNYRVFIICVVSAITSSLTVFGVAVFELANAMDNATLNPPFLDTGSLIVVSVVGVFSAIAALLLIHLCLFHGYIAYLGVTTYEYIRQKRDKNPGNPAVHKNSDSGPPVRYHFCEAAEAGKQLDSRNLYFCSTFKEENAGIREHVERDKKKFHLYFSYEARSNESTSIELTSRTQNAIVPVEQLNPPTPSPVSCCFSMIGPSSSKNKKDPNRVPRSCTTMKRIQTFLRTKLRKSARQRALNLEALGARKNKVSPESGDDSVKSISAGVEDALSPMVLPPLVLPSISRLRQGNQVHAVSELALSKRNQQNLRVRRSLLRKRPRFKVGNHVTESAQLSPIPESEQSKPASPHSSLQPDHFTFPPLHS